MSDEDERRHEQVENPQAGHASKAVVTGRVALLLRAPERRGQWLLAVVAVFVVTLIATGPRFWSPAGGDPNVTSVVIATLETASLIPATLPPTPLTATPSPSTTASTTPNSDPTWTLDLLGQLDCDGPPANIGAEVGGLYREGLSPESPEAALDVFVTGTMYTGFPVKGYAQTHLDRHWAQFAHLVDGRTKAVVVLRDAGPEIDPGIWSLVALRACDPAEFASGSGFTGGLLAVWLDADGARVPTTTILETQGPAHCDWQSTTWLSLDSSLYLRDPKGVLEHDVVVPFGSDVKLPGDARSTGYHQGSRTIWRNGDLGSIYVVSADRTELWPRPMDELGCM